MSYLKNMIIGYSCWGFLGNGIVDTPDGGRSHRLVLIKALISQGAKIIMLQKNRDLIEAHQDFSNKYISFNDKFPEIDSLFVEYRWKIPGRNCKVDERSKNYTPDLDRQNVLLRYYVKKNIPILIWDKDQKLNNKEWGKKNIIIFEAALKPRFHRKKILFPMDPLKTDRATKDIKKYSINNKRHKLVYIGNQYERNKSFKEFIDLPAKYINSDTYVFGNWNKYPGRYKNNINKFPHIKFMDRVKYNKINSIYKKSLTTVLIAPKRYYKSGQFTQRLFECLWGLCIPLAPKFYYGLDKIIIKKWQINSGQDMLNKINTISNQKNETIKKDFQKQFKLLKLFDAKSRAKIIIKEIENFYKVNKKIKDDYSENLNRYTKTKNFIIKKYKERSRFINELKYLALFKNKGFLVPKISSFNKTKKEIKIKNIRGTIYNKLNDKKLKQCLIILVNIIKKFGIGFHNKTQSKIYTRRLKENIMQYTKKNSLNINLKKLNSLINELEDICYISIFKDAKPLNWIFDNKKQIIIIDFDYVKKSFFLSDLAKLLTYNFLGRKLYYKPYLNYFLKNINIEEKNLKNFRIPFILAMINSNVSSMKYSKKISNETVQKLKKQNLELLKMAEVI